MLPLLVITNVKNSAKSVKTNVINHENKIMNKTEQIEFIEKNYKFSSGIHSNRRVRQNFFEKIETEMQAYLLGFYAADGNINEKRKTFRIHLQKSDSELVYLYKDMISPDARLFTMKERNVKGRNGQLVTAHESIGVDINSSKLCTDLVNLGFGYKKTYDELHLPNIDTSLIRHFIRGYFDGDGSICYYYCKPDPKWHKNERVRGQVSICGKTKTILEEIQKFLKTNNIESSICFANRDKMWILTVPKSQLKKLYNLFYDDSYFYLSRKFNKFNYYVNTEESQLIADLRNAQGMSVSNSNNSPTSVEHPTE